MHSAQARAAVCTQEHLANPNEQQFDVHAVNQTLVAKDFELCAVDGDQAVLYIRNLGVLKADSTVFAG